MRRELPSGTVTFLFTDIEGSTKILHELGAGYWSYWPVTKKGLELHGGRPGILVGHSSTSLDGQPSRECLTLQRLGRVRAREAEVRSHFGGHFFSASQ